MPSNAPRAPLASSHAEAASAVLRRLTGGSSFPVANRSRRSLRNCALCFPILFGERMKRLVNHNKKE